MTNNEYIQEVGVPPGNHGFQPKRPCNRAHEYADAFGVGPYNYAGTTASSQEDHVFSQFVARSCEDIRDLILSLLGNNVLSWQYCLPKKSLDFILMRRSSHLLARLGTSHILAKLLPYAVDWGHWQASAGIHFARWPGAVPASEVGLECDLCGGRFRFSFVQEAHVYFCTMDMYTRPIFLPASLRVRNNIELFRIRQVCSCEYCLRCVKTNPYRPHRACRPRLEA